jgi:hypothetical protein
MKRIVISKEEDHVFTLKGVDVDSIINIFNKSELESKKLSSEPAVKAGPNSGGLSNLIRHMPSNFSFTSSDSYRIKLYSRFNERLEKRLRTDFENKSLVKVDISNRLDRTTDSTNIPCDWCRLSFDTPPMYLPITDKIDIKGVRTYYGIDNYCTTECIYAIIEEDQKLPASHRDPLLKDSKKLIKEIHEKLYPGKPLKAAPSYKLLKQFGGHLQEDEYRQQSSSNYIRTGFIRFAYCAILSEYRTAEDQTKF